jgi:predicted GNAT family acetyltransferase
MPRRRAGGSLGALDGDAISVTHLPEERRYELSVAGEPAGELVYRDRGGGVVAFLHTEVDPNVRLRGLGSALVAAALDDARERGLRVVPICPLVDAYVRRHPGYADRVVADPARRV